MAHILETKNVFEPRNTERSFHAGGVSIRQWLQIKTPGFSEFDTPTICAVNGKYLKREQWDYVIEATDVVQFIALPPQGIYAIIVIAVVALVALSLAFALTVDVPTTPGELPESDPVFSTRGQQNVVRLGEPIEVCYGRNRIYPAVAARPYFQYFDNQQFQHSIFCLGQGEFAIHEVRIGDTDIDVFTEVQYEIVPPGSTVTLFPTSVYTSVEVGDQEIYGSNEDEYVPDGWEGPFAANPSGTLITGMQVDVAFPRGLYRINDDGEVRPAQITVEIQYREIDDAGAPVGPGTWVAFTSPSSLLFNFATVTPQRRTVQGPTVAEGRYEVRIRRLTIKVEDHRSGHMIIWESLKGFAPESQAWGDVTLLAVKIQASSNLNDQTQVRFNVIATRKLPVWESGGGWSAPIETRSIVWAFVDVFKALYGGRVTDTFLDLSRLEELDAAYEGRNEHFDWIFRDPITVWEAARTIARVGRAVPLLIGSLITMRRDELQEVPVMFFTPDNMVAGSFNWNLKMWEVNEHDSLQVAYIDPNTGYSEETVIATLPGGTTDNPEDLRIPGIQDRDHAYREALYTLGTKKYLRENISFDTGLEGYIGSYGDLVIVGHDTPSWGQTGYIVASEYISGSEHRLTVSEPLDFSAPGSKVMMLRNRQGEAIGPFPVNEGDNAMQPIISAGASNYDFLTGGENEPMLYVFGVAGVNRKLAKIVRIEPQGGEVIRITCVNDAPEIYTLEENSANPGPGTPPSQELPDPKPPLTAPTLLIINQIDTDKPTVQLYWSPVPGVNRYVVETSIDGETWVNRGEHTQTGLVLEVGVGELHVRVGAVTNEGVGPFITEEFDVVGGGLGLIILLDWEYLEWKVGWLDAPNVMDWVIRVYDNTTESTPILGNTYTRTWERRLHYTYQDAIWDNLLVRDHRVEVQARYIDDSLGPIMAHNFTNPIPLPPTAPGHEIPSGGESGTEVAYRLFWTVPNEADLIRVKVWLSATNGFDPEVVTPVVDETAAEPGQANVIAETFVIVPLSGGAHAAQYWRVALFDVWGDEIDTNITAQQTIPAYP